MYGGCPGFESNKEIVLEEFDFNSGGHLRMSWFRDRYNELVEA